LAPDTALSMIGRMRHDDVVHRLAVVIAAALAIAAALVAVPSTAAGIVDTAARQLGTDPVYVDPAARDMLPPVGEQRVEQEIETAGAGPLYVVVLPESASREAGGDATETLRAVAVKLHRRGTYAGVIGNHFRALSNVLPTGKAGKLATEAIGAHRSDGVAATLVDFVDRVADARNGGSSGSGSSNWWVAIAAIGAAIAGGFVFIRRRRNRAQLAAVKKVARDDLIALAEDVQELEHRVEGKPKAREAYDRALAAYEQASSTFDRAGSPEQLSAVAESLDEGRHEMALAEAELEGRKPPERRPPCFFDPRHGPSMRDVEWAPPGGSPRLVPACEADAQRVERGEEPQSREVPVKGAMVPYWSAPAYGGYFGGFLPGLLIGTSLGDWGGGGEPVAVGSGDLGGDDGFDSGDFGGDLGGGDFGGGGNGDAGGGSDF
jgi:LPXTG-motif cell wall-anchored protein